MKLIYRIVIRISLVMLVVLAAWALLFYVAMINEVNDELDDSLEDYSEMIIIRALTGAQLPSADNGSNNQYFLTKVSHEYASTQHEISYKDSLIYIVEKEETEPARILTTIFYDKAGEPYQLTVSAPSIGKDDLSQAIQKWIIFLYVALLLTVIIIFVLLFQRNMRPLYTLLQWLDKYQVGKQNKPLQNDTPITEFRQLNEAAVRNAARHEQIFEQQKQFIGNASHEMQTPLSVCLNRLEMLMEDESLSEAQLAELIKTLQTLEYMTRLNKSLLLLSKIDNLQFGETRDLELNDVLRHYIDDYKDVYAHRRITTSVVEEGAFRVSMNESLATVLLTNLLKNAYVHNVDGGEVRIEISQNYFIFRNSAADGALDAEHIFERFYQGNKKDGSMGLGLAIVDSICRLHSLGLSYRFEGGEHCFIISH